MHVGKSWPTSLVNRVRNGNSGTYQTPPRKLSIDNAPMGQSGSVAIAWQDLVVVSSVGERWSGDELWTIYTFEHPTDSSLTIVSRIRYKVSQPAPGFPAYSEYEWHTEAFSGATVVARNEITTTLDLVFGGAQYGLTIGPTWGYQPTPSLWLSNSMRIGWASWPQQPEYHPYRYEP